MAGREVSHDRRAGRRRSWGTLLLVMLGWASAGAHVGAPDVYVKAAAGPYGLMVSVHPPVALPGAAEIEVRAQDGGVTAVAVSVTGGSSQALQRFAAEQTFTGSVWVSNGGAWRVVIHVSGDRGEAVTSVAVPGSALPAGGSARGIWVWLVVGLGVILGAYFGWGRGRSWVAVGCALLCLGIGVAAAWMAMRRPAAVAAMQVELQAGGRLEVALPGDQTGLVEDHGHRMHLFAVREPEMDVLLHLHPGETGTGRFSVELPSMAPGGFALYADVVRGGGRLETFTASAGLPMQVGRALAGDDSVGVVPGLSRSTAFSGPGAVTVRLMDGFGMRLELAAPLRARVGQMLRVTLLDGAGSAPGDMQLYMGMAAHAAVFKRDGTVFAHIHPGGTMPMTGMEMGTAATNAVEFPFGFPSAGWYRVFVEMKRGGTVETGAFDLSVGP